MDDRAFDAAVQNGDPLLDPVWGAIEDARIPVVIHCGSGPAPGEHTGPEPIRLLLQRYPRLRLIIAHMGMPEYVEFLHLAERHDSVMLDTTMAFTGFIEEDAPFPSAELPRLAALGNRVLLGTDFPNIPYPYAGALEALEGTGHGPAWLRAVCRDNAARIFAL